MRVSRAGFAVRAAAAAVDAAVGLGASLLLSSTAGMFFARRAVATLRIGDPETVWQGPVPMILGAFGEVVYLLPFGLLVAWLLDPLTGATAGKRLLRIRVRGKDGAPAPFRQLTRRTLMQTAGCWGWTLALVAGRWEIAAAATIGGIVVLTGCLMALGPERRALHDRLAGTSVHPCPCHPATPGDQS